MSGSGGYVGGGIVGVWVQVGGAGLGWVRGAGFGYIEIDDD